MKRTEFLGMVTLFAGCVWVLLYALQHTGIYDVKGELAPYLARLPFVGYTVAEERLTPAELQKRELERVYEAIAAKEQVLANKELELTERENALKLEVEVLEQRRRQIREIENKLAEQARLDEDETRRLNRLVDIYSAMPPEAAAKQIEALEDNLAIEMLKRMKSDVVAIVLSQMSKDRATTLTLKMGKPESAMR